MCSSNFAFEELVLRSLRASRLMKPFLTPGGWQELKCVYWKVSVGLKLRAHIKNKECFLNRSPLYTHVSKKVISVSEISAVNFIVGLKVFACSMKLFILCLCSLEKRCFHCLFPNEWFVGLWLMIAVSTSAKKKLQFLFPLQFRVFGESFPVEMESILFQDKS